MDDYDAYLFDWDGTLADSHMLWMEIIRSQLQRYDIELTDQQIVEQLFGRYRVGITELNIPSKDFKQLDEELTVRGTQGMPNMPLFPQAREVLETLVAKGKKLALITASYRQVIDITITEHKLLETFDVVVTGDEVTMQKPDPEGLTVALKALGVMPRQAVMIGDSKKDILAGRNAGTDTLLFAASQYADQHNSIELRQCQPTYTISTWQELLDQL
jgi:pyrophosphatase PpaX